MNYLEESKDTNSEISTLFDRYLKSNNNFLPLQAYLQYLENESFDAFTSICHFKSFLKNAESTGSLPKLNSPNSRADVISLSGDGNLGSTLTIINNTTTLLASTNVSPDQSNSSLSPSSVNQNQTNVILAQKLYKIIVSIDYSPQTTSLDFISKSLEKLFAKITNEYNDFFQMCSNIEPQVYVTVLVWNLAYFDYAAASTKTQARQSFDLKFNKLNSHLPFTILCLSKRLLKSNLQEIHNFIFKELIEVKHVFLEPFKNQEPSEYHYDMNGEPIVNKNLNEKNSSYTKSTHIKENLTSSFEELLDNIVKIFNYFVANEFSTATMAATSLALCHHIHITDGNLWKHYI